MTYLELEIVVDPSELVVVVLGLAVVFGAALARAVWHLGDVEAGVLGEDGKAGVAIAVLAEVLLKGFREYLVRVALV